MLTDGLVFSLPAVQEPALLLLQQVLEPLELVDVEGLEPDQLLPHDQSHLLSRVHTGMPGKPTEQGLFGRVLETDPPQRVWGPLGFDP